MSLSTEKMNVLYIHGRHSFAEISRMDGRSETTIYHLLKNSGTEIRNRSEANQIFPDLVFIAFYNLGLSCSQIGKLLDVHPTTIIKRLKIIKFPLRSKQVASAIRYSDEEFTRYFENEEFETNLLFVKLATGRFLESLIDE